LTEVCGGCRIDEAWEFLGSEVVLYDTVMMDTWHYALGKIHRMVQHKA